MKKTEDFILATCKKCKDYILYHVIGNANSHRAMLGVEMLEYFKKQELILVDAQQNHNISSDIIESSFGIYKEKEVAKQIVWHNSIYPLYTVTRETCERITY